MNEEGIVFGDAPEQVAQEFTPQLSGIGEEKVVAVFNPLPVQFRVRFARQQAYRPTPDPNRQFAREKGLPLDAANPKAYATHEIVLPAQQIKNLPGDIAQIAVRKLITAIIQTRNEDGSYDFEKGSNRKGLVPDPQFRKEVEGEIVRGVYDATEFFNQGPQVSQAQATEQQIEKLNDPVKEAVNERSSDPAPGTGVHYTPKEAVSTGASQSNPAKSSSPTATKAAA